MRTDYTSASLPNDATTSSVQADTEPASPRPRSRIVAVGGGKGGVGKSFIASSLGIALARRGRRVVMVDADLGGANLHTALGLPLPKVSLSDLIHRSAEHIEDIRVATDIPNLTLVSGAHDYLMAANVNFQQKQRVLREIRSLDADVTVVDIGAGTSWNVVDFFLLADHGIVVVSPEPASVQAVFRFVKTCFYRRLSRIAPGTPAAGVVLKAMSVPDDAGVGSSDLLRVVKEMDPETGRELERQAESFRPWLVVNNVRYAEDKRLGPTMAGVCFKRLGIEMDCMNPVYFDDRIWQANRTGKPYMLMHQGAPAAKNLDTTAARVLRPLKLDRTPSRPV